MVDVGCDLDETFPEAALCDEYLPLLAVAFKLVFFPRLVFDGELLDLDVSVVVCHLVFFVNEENVGLVEGEQRADQWVVEVSAKDVDKEERELEEGHHKHERWLSMTESAIGAVKPIGNRRIEEHPCQQYLNTKVNGAGPSHCYVLLLPFCLSLPCY